MCTHGYLVNCALMDSDGSSQPSRWQGRRVDYALSTQAGLLSAPSYWDDVLSDHKVYMVSLHLGYEEAFNEYMVPTRPYLKPDGASSDVWRKTIARHWQHAMPSLLPLRRRRSGILSMRRSRSVCAVQLWSMVVASLKTGGPRAQCHGLFLPLTTTVARAT